MSSGYNDPTVGAGPDLDDLWPPFAPVPPRHGSAPRHYQGRRQARPLTRDEIVRAAIAIADAEGASAVNMRRIARELDGGRCRSIGTLPTRTICSTS